jgi:DNA ligase-1
MSEQWNTWPTLYKMTSTGAIQMWNIRVETYDHPAWQYIITHGQYGGKLQETSTIVATGKNKGRTNETGIWEQCCKEADSLWTKQKDRKGYTETIPKEKPLRPMLAKSYDKDGHHIKFPCYIQPKLDGIRCLAKRTKKGVDLISRQGKVFKSLPHIEKQLMWMDVGTILDGELYVHGEEFQEIISAVKRDTPSKKSGKVEYHVYDMIDNNNYANRIQWLIDRLPRKLSTFITQIRGIRLKSIYVVETYTAINNKEIWHKHKLFTQDGYEGAIVRNAFGKYKINGRSSDLQKVKKFIDMEFEIIGAEENKGKMAGQCSFICKTKGGATFKVKPKGDEALRRQYWNEWQAGVLMGKMLTVRFFSWTTSEKPVPRFPIGIVVRNYE